MRAPLYVRYFTALLVACLTVLILSSPATQAATVIPNSDFSLEVSPSPLVTTVKPGQPSTVQLRIRNASLQEERLAIEARDFTTDPKTGKVTLGTSTPADLAQWVSFSNKQFAVPAGQWYTQTITIALPEAAGFSYPFAVVIARTNTPGSAQPGNRLRGSIAVFTLVNIDKPGATRKLEIESLTTDQGIYEFLPATVKIKLKNTGNSIVQPYGNLFIQADGTATQPLKVLGVNDSKTYILPGTTKEISATWNDGFPHYETSAPDQNGKTTSQLKWDWSATDTLRFGHYNARVVAAYNDGARDVPLTAQVGFWVIPWRIIAGALVILVILGFGIWTIFKRFTHHAGRVVRRKK